MPENKTNSKLPPNNLEAEQSVLGSMLLNARCVDDALSELKTEDFFNQQHRNIFAAMERLTQTGVAVDLVTVADKLEKDEKMQIGGVEYLSRLMQGVPSTSNLSDYIKIVKEKSQLRKLLKAGIKIVDECYKDNNDVENILNTAGDAIYNIAVDATARKVKHISEAMTDSLVHIGRAMKSKDGMMGISTGFPLMDKMLSGLQEAQLIVIAGRPGMGKTAFALNIIQHVSLIKKQPCLIFSLEMPSDQLATRLMCSQARMDSQVVRSGHLDKDDIDRLGQAMMELSRAPIHIDDTASLTVTEIRAMAQNMKRTTGLGVVVIDYLQLLQSKKRAENRVLEVSEMTRSLKIMAKDLGVPILLLSQLSRASEKRDKKSRYPLLSDLRESGSIEQDADVVIFLQREDYYEDERTDENIGKARIIIAKQRSGPTGAIHVKWRGEYTKYEEIDLVHDEEEAPTF